MAGMWILSRSMISVARGQSGNGSGWLVPHHYIWASVVWVARRRDCVMSYCWLWGFLSFVLCLENRAIGLLATEGDPHPECSGQEEGRSFLASSRTSLAVAATPSFQACLRACTCCVPVCVYVCVWICVYEHVYMYVQACIRISIRMHVYTCVYVCVYVYKYVHFFAVSLQACVQHMCVYAYIYMYVHAYVYHG